MAKRVPSLIRSIMITRPSVRSFASGSGYSRSTLFAQGNPYPSRIVPFDSSNTGIDYKHWLVLMKEPKGSREEIIQGYVKTLATILGSEEEARKAMYSVSTRYYFAFGAIMDVKISDKLKQLPNVNKVVPDGYHNMQTKDYGGEPFIDGEAVPYDPKYHEACDNTWAISEAAAAEDDSEVSDTDPDEDFPLDPYDPKYHEMFDKFWAKVNARRATKAAAAAAAKAAAAAAAEDGGEGYQC